MTHLLGYLLVFLGGGLGSMLRHAVNQTNALLLGAGFWGTLFVNITGSFAMGLMAGWFAFRGEGGGQALRLFLTTGILVQRFVSPYQVNLPVDGTDVMNRVAVQIASDEG